MLLMYLTSLIRLRLGKSCLNLQELFIRDILKREHIKFII